jgi:hypothetical protein
LLGCGGGAAALEDVGLHTAKGAVRGAFEGMRELPASSLLQGIAGDPNLRKAAHDVTESMVLGVGDGVTKASLEQRIDVLATTLLTTARNQGNTALTQIIDEQGPKLKAIVRDTLLDSLSDASAVIQAKAKTDLSEATHALVSEAVRSFAAAIRDEGGAAALGLAAEQISGGAVRGLRAELANPETVAAIGAISRKVAAEAVAGAEEKGRSATVWIVLAVVGLSLFTLCAGAFALTLRRYTLASRTLALVSAQINAAERANQDGASIKDLKRSIKTKAESSSLQRFLSAFLVDRGL